MRIAHLIDDLGCGGAEQVVASLASYQSRYRHSVQVICLRDIGPNPVDVSALAAAGVEIVSLDKPPGFHFGTLRKLRDHLKCHRIEVLHTHNHLVHHYGVVAGRWASVPVILNTLHGSVSLQSSAVWARVLFWFSCLLSHRLVCVDQKVRDVFRQGYFFPDSKLGVVENGADLGRFLALPRRTTGETVTFGNIGRLDPVKGHDILLKAIALLRREHLHVRLRILGDGDLQSDLRALAQRLSITDAVSFEGFSLDTPAFLANTDVYVISSLSEGLPLTLLEAMAAGVPVVATAVGGIPKVIDKAKCGWVCPPNNPEALADAMRQALLAPDLATIGARGRAATKKSFSIERMARDYEDLYLVLLG